VSNDDKDKGGKVLPFPLKKPEHISKIVEGIMSDIINNLPPADKEAFINQMDNGAEITIKQSDQDFRYNMNTVNVEDMSELIEKFDIDDLNRMMDSVDDLKGRAFNYTKQIEWQIFELAHSLDHTVLKEITEDLQKLFLKLGKKG
jgi:hypothetical protein